MPMGLLIGDDDAKLLEMPVNYRSHSQQRRRATAEAHNDTGGERGRSSKDLRARSVVAEHHQSLPMLFWHSHDLVPGSNNLICKHLRVTSNFSLFFSFSTFSLLFLLFLLKLEISFLNPSPPAKSLDE